MAFAKIILISMIFSCIFFGCADPEPSNIFSYKFCEPKHSAKLLSYNDSHSANWTKFDIESRVGKKNASKKELDQFVLEQVRPWTDKEKRRVLKAMKILEEKLANHDFEIPVDLEINFIKTSGKEEGDASAYTRSNHIIFTESGLKTTNANKLARLLTHEIFHVMTRKYPIWRQEMYKTIDFFVKKRVRLPKEFDELRISNPDAPFYDAYVDVQDGDQKKRYVFFLLSETPYDGGSFFNYVITALVEIDPVTNHPVIIDHQLQYKKVEDVPSLYDKLSQNTFYLLDPEEILAENFVLMVFGDKNIIDKPLIDKMNLVMNNHFLRQ